jgi:3-methylcrotonyl-CoA carboxylase beta subunit
VGTLGKVMTNPPSPAHATDTPGSTPREGLREYVSAYMKEEAKIRMGGGQAAIDRQHEKGRLTARERVALLIDAKSEFQELGLWSAYGMYTEYGGAPAAGVITGLGRVHGRQCMIIANDATVKAGAFFPMTCKKIIRAQQIAMMARLPLLYLVDSAGVFLPLQEDVFPDTDDFGRIFRNNAVISASGIPQIAAIMGFCVAGGGYLPVLCDTLLMTEGSGLYLAGPALVKAAIGQEVTDEELGGAQMHAQISGTIDFREKDDAACIHRLRSLLEKYNPSIDGTTRVLPSKGTPAFGKGDDVYNTFNDKPGGQYDVRDIIGSIVDATARTESGPTGTTESLVPDFDEYKSEYGQSVVCGYAKIGGHACGLVANQKKLVMRTMAGGKAGPSKATQMPGVIYDDSADKSARFIMDCNQRKIPLVFLHDTTGFMVGRDSEQGGIIRAGAKMVNAMSNCMVPKIVLILGGSYGAGNYAMCGRAFDQFVALAWPGAKCAVMGANQATGVLTTIEEASRKRKGETIDPETHKQITAAIHAGYTQQADIRHGASRGWIDRIIQPHRTREELIGVLEAASQGWDYAAEFKTGVLQT